MHHQVASDEVGAAKQQVTRTGLGEAVGSDVAAEGGRTAGEAAADIDNAFTRGGRAAAGSGGVKQQVRADDGRGNGVAGAVDEETALIGVREARDLQQGATADALGGVDTEDAGGAGDSGGGSGDGRDGEGIGDTEVRDRDRCNTRDDALGRASIRGEGDVTHTVGGGQDAGGQDAHAGDVGGGVGNGIDGGCQEAFTASGGHPELAIDTLNDQDTLVGAAQVAGSAQLGAEAGAVLQADVRTGTIVDGARRGDRDVCGRVVLLEQVERTTVDGQHCRRAKGRAGVRGISASTADAEIDQGVGPVGQKRAQPGLDDGACRRGRLANDACGEEGHSRRHVNRTRVRGCGGSDRPGRGQRVGDQQGCRGHGGGGSRCEGDRSGSQGVPKINIVADAEHTCIDLRGGEAVDAVQDRRPKARLNEGERPADVAGGTLCQGKSCPNVKRAARGHEVILVGRHRRHGSRRNPGRAGHGIAGEVVHRAQRHGVPEAQRAATQHHERRVRRDVAIAVHHQRTGIDLGQAAVAGAVQAREFESASTRLDEAAGTGTNAVNDIAGDDEIAGGAVLGDDAHRGTRALTEGHGAGERQIRAGGHSEGGVTDEVHRVAQIDGLEGSNQAKPVVLLQGAAIEGDGTGTEGTRSANLQVCAGVDRNASAKHIAGGHGIDGDGAAVVDKTDALRGDGIIDRANLQRIASTGEHLAVHLQGGIARAKAEDRAAGGKAGGGVVATHIGTQIGIAATIGAEVNGLGEADHVNGDGAGERPAVAVEGDGGQCTARAGIVIEAEDAKASTVTVEGDAVGERTGRAEDTAGIDGDGSCAQGRLVIGRSTAHGPVEGDEGALIHGQSGAGVASRIAPDGHNAATPLLERARPGKTAEKVDRAASDFKRGGPVEGGDAKNRGARAIGGVAENYGGVVRVRAVSIDGQQAEGAGGGVDL